MLSCATFSMRGAAPAWRIAASLTDADDSFTASHLAANLSAAGLALDIVDVQTITNASQHVVVIGRGGGGGGGGGRAEGYSIGARLGYFSNFQKSS